MRGVSSNEGGWTKHVVSPPPPPSTQCGSGGSQAWRAPLFVGSCERSDVCCPTRSGHYRSLRGAAMESEARSRATPSNSP